MINILTYFSNISGQKISSNKSKLFFPLAFQSFQVPSNFVFSISACTDLGKYLGFPLSQKTPKHSTFTFLLDNIYKRIHIWEHKYFILAGKVVLIKTTLASLPTHLMQITILPSSTLESIDKLHRDFLWES